MSLDERNKVLNDALEVNPIDENIAALVRADQRRKRQVLALFVSILLDVIITIGLFFITVKTQSIAQQAETNHESLVRNCQTTNEARANNKQLWAYLLDATPATQPPPEQQKQLDQFRQLVNKTFAPRDCTQIK